VHWQKHSYRDICSTPETTKTVALPSAGNTQHTPHGNDVVGKELFASSFSFGHLANSLPSAWLTLGKKKKSLGDDWGDGDGMYVECRNWNTLGKELNPCRVPKNFSCFYGLLPNNLNKTKKCINLDLWNYLFSFLPCNAVHTSRSLMKTGDILSSLLAVCILVMQKSGK
jgi:hypothetical protein